MITFVVYRLRMGMTIVFFIDKTKEKSCFLMVFFCRLAEIHNFAESKAMI